MSDRIERKAASRRGEARRIALALGGGGARGLAHIPMLEALDELGVRPAAIAGTSMGAIFGAAYAAGLSGREIHEATLSALNDRRGILRKIRSARTGRLSDLLAGLGNPWAIDAELFCDLILPEGLPARFEDCGIALTIVATDYFARKEVAYSAGPLRPAVAASIAIPGLVRPVEIDGRLMIDGAAVDPLPVAHLPEGPDIVLAAIDVTGGPPRPSGSATPTSFEVMLGALQILQSTIVEEKLRRRPPDILIRPNVDLFRALDFFQASVILRLAQPAKEAFKRQLAAKLA
jgi:NTE family protein